MLEWAELECIGSILVKLRCWEVERVMHTSDAAMPACVTATLFLGTTVSSPQRERERRPRRVSAAAPPGRRVACGTP